MLAIVNNYLTPRLTFWLQSRAITRICMLIGKKGLADTGSAPVAQWIEHTPRKVWSRVRFLPGANPLRIFRVRCSLREPYERLRLSRVKTRG